MNSANDGAVAVIGGPASGKSTWLGSVLDTINAGESDVLDSPPGGWPLDASAVNTLTEPLANCRYPVRTSKAHNLALELGLQASHPALGERDFQLRVSDYAGEQLDRLFVHRTRGWSQAWRSRASASALLLFIRPAADLPLPRSVTVTGGSPWAQALSEPDPAQGAAAPLGPISPTDHFPSIDDEIPEVEPPGPRDAVRIPSVLSLVEMLQFLRAERGYGLGRRPPRGTLRVAVVISAWDAVDPKWRDKGPNRYLAEHMPLLEQFLHSSFHDDDVFRFGLSATGGDLKDPQYREKYEQDPNGWTEWTAVDGSIASTTEIGLPLLWALFGDPALCLGR